MSITLTSFVEASFTGWHDAPFSQRLHAHWWRVRLHYRREQRENALPVKAALAEALARLSQERLAETLGMDATNEGIAVWLASQLAHLTPTKIEVWREAEGLGATLEIAP